jgi:DNA modification methylase
MPKAAQQWQGCYDDTWHGLIVPDAFRHPAKFAYGLITRIVDYGLTKGYWAAGDVIIDPFGGVGLGGIVCAYRGLRWLGVDCEKHFVDLARANFALHAGKLQRLRSPLPLMLHGDSRDIGNLVIGASAITSPPYAAIATGAGGLNIKPPKHPGQQSGRSPHSPSQSADQHYGAGAITSPPYVSGGHHTDVFDAWNVNSRGQKIEKETAGYGKSSAQIGRLKETGYMGAMLDVYRGIHRALHDGGVFAVVVKDYVKNGRRIPLCNQTWELLHIAGFNGIERIHALLVQHYSHHDLFEGEVKSKRERKSFFRRMSERKGSPAIDYEEILFVRKTPYHDDRQMSFL